MSGGFGRSYGRLTVVARAGGALVPVPGATVRLYLPGTTTPYSGALYPSADSLAPITFPVLADAGGTLDLWGDAPIRLDAEVSSAAYGSQRETLDLEPPPDAADPYPLYATDADLAAHAAAVNPHPGYLTAAEGDAAYAPLDPGGGGYLTQTAGDTRYVNTAGDTITGALSLSGPVSTNRTLRYQTAGLDRWSLVIDANAETGSNAGSAFAVYRHDDAGNYLGTALTITRATGAATFGGAVTAADVQALGASAQISFRDRSGGNGFLWYTEAGTARLHNAETGQQPIVVNASGVVSVPSFTFGGGLGALDGTGGARLAATGAANIVLEPAGGYVLPASDLGATLGLGSLRFQGIYANGMFASGAVTAGALSVTGNLGLFGTAATTKKTVTGSRAGNAALASLLTQLAAYGLLTDSSTA